jgi:hypothetical protein
MGSASGTYWFDDFSLTPTSQFIANGGFEAGPPGWQLAPQASIDTNPADAHSGNNSLQLVATAAWQASWQSVPVTAGQPYLFTGWGRSSAGYGDFTLISYDVAGNPTGAHRDITFSATGNWLMTTGTYLAPANAVRVDLGVMGSASGTYWFDDFSLTPTSQFIANGGFEAGPPGWQLAPQASIDTNPADAHSGNNSLQLVTTGASQGTWQTIPVNPGQVYTFSGWGRSASVGGAFTLISYDANGNQVGPHTDVSFAGTGSWVLSSCTYIAPPMTARVDVAPWSYASGTFWFDDLTLSPLH